MTEGRDSIAARPPDRAGIVVFDGSCVMCSRIARFIRERDRRDRLALEPAQSPRGSDICRRCGVEPEDPSTLVLLQDGQCYVRSAAALRIAGELGFPWALAGAARVVPPPLRDAVYNWVSRHRHRLFGK